MDLHRHIDMWSTEEQDMHVSHKVVHAETCLSTGSGAP